MSYSQQLAISLREISATLRAANDAADATSLQRIQADLETLMLRHGRTKMTGIFIDALMSAEFRGAKW